MLTWMCDKKNYYSMCHYETTQSQHCNNNNNYNDDNVMRVNM